MRIVDGNHLPASQKRLKPLRGFRGAGFIVREHGASPNPRALGKPCRAGRIETGMVHEQKVSIEDETGQPLLLRRIELDLDEPTEDGESVIVLLTNLPKSQFTARKIARLYRRRWHMENLFQRLESVLYSEVSSLGPPRAALLAFGVAVMADNVLAILQAAVRARHDLQAADIELSSYYLATEIKAQYTGMMTAVVAQVWRAYDALTALQLGRILRKIAAHVDAMTMRKHPRGLKKPKKKGYVSGAVARRHVATARVLKEGRVN